MDDVFFMIYDRKRKATCVCTKSGFLHHPGKPDALLDYWCLRYGSTMKGRQDALRHHLNVRVKIPVMVHDAAFFFPSESSKNATNIWFCAGNIIAATKLSSCLTKVSFRNGDSLIINIGVRTMRKQLRLCALYRNLLRIESENGCCSA